MAIAKIEMQLRSATACIEVGGELLEAIDTFCGKVSRSVDNAIEKADEIKHTYVKQASRVRPSLQQLIIAVENAASYVEKVADFTFYCSREEGMTSVMTAVRGGDFQPLGLFIDQLQRCLAQAEQCHREFVEACNESSKVSSDEAEKCKHEAITARSKKESTQLIGDAGKVTAIAGVALSFAAGLLTAGAGTVVALGVAGAAVGGGAAVSTIAGSIARELEDTEKSFKELSGIFDSLASDASTLYSHVLHLHRLLQGIATVLDDVEVQRVQLALHQERPRTRNRLFSWLQRKLSRERPASEASYRVEPVSAALELLYRKNTVAHTTTSRCRDSMKALGQKVRDKM